jgi:hypothetical protein
MKISKTHQRFANDLQELYGISNQDVLDNPQSYLGPNWEAVINFWLYLDTLSKEQLKFIGENFESWIYEGSNEDYEESKSTAVFTTGYTYHAGTAVYWSVYCGNSATECATYELIGLQKLLEQGHQPVFFPLFLNL